MQRSIAKAGTALAAGMGLALLVAPSSHAQDPSATLGLFPAGKGVCFRAPQPGEAANTPMAADVAELTLWSILPPKGLTTPGKTQVFVGIDVVRSGTAKPGSVTATCTPDRGFLRCVIDCAGGSFALQAGTGGALGLYNSIDGMRLQACALTADAS